MKDFEQSFRCLTGNEPFPWQRGLFKLFVEKLFPEHCDIPTGLGKTSTIAVWLLALAHHVLVGRKTGFPRRLIYVVNRRTVVDQATREIEKMRTALASLPDLGTIAGALGSLAAQPSAVPLAISTLRGQFADNAEWRSDPARPAVIAGTVDMIGSRLLFTGYGCGFKSRPLQAGFLGQDVLLIHDEAHLEPAFQELIAAIEREQKRCGDFGRLRVMALTATSRNSGNSFQLTPADRQHPEVAKRIKATKRLDFHQVDNEKRIADQTVECALKHKDSGKAIIIFLQKLDDVNEVTKRLSQAKQHFQKLTGTMRGLERDSLAKDDAIFARFMPRPAVTPQDGTVYLVCTSAGEVGVDISADHMVCDLTPFDSMAQRLGRVNRFGKGDARVDIVHLREDKFEKKDFSQACQRTLLLLNKLPQGDDELFNGSPAALSDLDPCERQNAFTPQPEIFPASEILFDAWALTSIRQKLPGRPPIADWLHGRAEWEPLETRVAWREEVDLISGPLLGKHEPVDLLDDYPLLPHELLRDRTQRVLQEIQELARRCPDANVWLITADGEVKVFLLPDLIAKNNQNKPLIDLSECVVILPPTVGGLNNGVLDGSAIFDETRRDNYDVADRLRDETDGLRRRRIWDNDQPPTGMRLVRTIDVSSDIDEESDEEDQPTIRRYWHWYANPGSAADDGSRTAVQTQNLKEHLQSAERVARAFIAKLELKDPVANAICLAARWHDLGKDRAIWQRAIGNHNYPGQVLAKSGGGMRPIDLNSYRHELGSLIDISNFPEFAELCGDEQELVLHLIAAHHGRGRPHFSEEEAFDPEREENAVSEIVREIPRRFSRLQRKYGRWGLAYIESLVRAADIIASQPDLGISAVPLIMDATGKESER